MTECLSGFKNLLEDVFVFFYKRVGTRIVLWTEQQEQELETLFEEFKDSDGTRLHIVILCCPSIHCLALKVNGWRTNPTKVCEIIKFFAVVTFTVWIRYFPTFAYSVTPDQI